MMFCTVSLPRIMIDAVDLVLFQKLSSFAIERLGRGEVVAERLFDDDAAKRALSSRARPASPRCVADRREEPQAGWRDKTGDAFGGALSLHPFKRLAQSRRRSADPRARPERRPTQLKSFLASASSALRVANFGRLLARSSRNASSSQDSLSRDADQGEVVRQQPGRREIVERGNQQPVRQIARRAENHQSAGGAGAPTAALARPWPS